jgi:hypothetical protein
MATTITSTTINSQNQSDRPTRSVGSYETSDNSVAFIREQDIGVYASGLRPSTRLYVFFDGILVSDYITPATLDFSLTNAKITDFRSTGSRGDAAYSNSSGYFSAILHIPRGSFFTGDRQVIITDVADLSLLSSASTSASYVFHAFNHSTTSANSSTIISTRPYTYSDTSAISSKNPLAQSIYVGSDELNGAEGIFATSVDLYFSAKDSIQGVTVEIRSMENGVPTTKVLPFSTKEVLANTITTSATGTTATRVTFNAPVFLAADNYYALCITANGNNPNYRLHTAVVGQPDLVSSRPVIKNWGSGDLFTSTNGFTWVPTQNEYLKFKLNRAEFTSSANSSVSLVNKNYEFMYLSNTYDYFEQGEYVFKLGSNQAFTNATTSSNTISINSNTLVVTLQGLSGTITSGFTQFSNTTILIASNGSVYDTLFVNNVTNTTSLSLKNKPRLTGNVSVQNTPSGRVSAFNLNKLDLTLEDSNAANSSFKFTKGDTIIGVISQANAQIGVLRDRVINRFTPFFHNTVFPATQLEFDMVSTVSGTYDNTSVVTYDMNHTNYISDAEIVVASRSSEIANMSSRKSMTANIFMTSNNSYVSPFIDLDGASVIAYKNLITPAAYGENTKSGLAINKYISKTITLANGLDSEDLIVYLDAYKPVGTSINVYGKFLSASDPDSFDSKDWTLLLQDSSTAMYSDSINLNDIREFKFTVPKSPFATAKSGVVSVNTSSTTMTGISTTFTTDLAIGDLIKTYSDSTKLTFQISKVTAIANNTQLTIDNAATFTTSVGSYDRVDFPKTAFINEQNDNVIRYYDSTGVIHDAYSTYAIKIVLLANNTYSVPRVLNMRAIAVS